ncbi:hypothetical protein J2741_001942 [Methanolinea mesophila]|uniref:hypothetical protein n=1 Tax=Methanolinea mesophila TaxID=547055 RepID=UPI001AEB2796|nr:hypothetical protein [Methanolinea mesophila]MBP1929395.1 hypothetical protein [Methanolinea mesophila]
MKDEDILDDLIRGSSPLGRFSLTELVAYVGQKRISGVACAREGGKRYYVLFSEGEPEGAELFDEQGSLFGNAATYHLKGNEAFTLYALDTPVADRLILRCRVFDKSHLKKNISVSLPQIGKKPEGIGIFSMKVTGEGTPLGGMQVTIRKGGQVLGSDMTNREGRVSFKLLHGRYECVVSGKGYSLRAYDFVFNPGQPEGVLELGPA